MFTSGTVVILLIILAFAALMIWTWNDFRRLPERRETWQREHEPVSDTEFLQRLGISAPGREAMVALAVRRAVASECGVAVDSVPPDAMLGEFDRVTWDGLDGTDVIAEIEKTLGIKLTTRDAEQLPTPSRFNDLGQWVAAVVQGVMALNAARATQ